MKELSPNEGLVYSALLSHSLMESESFLADGSFSIPLARNYVLDNDGFIDLYPLSTKQLMKRTELTFPSVKKIMKILEHKFIIGSGFIKCPVELLDKGHMNIPPETGLKGQQLIFYGYLIDLCRTHGGVTDRWASRMKDDCGLNSEDNVYFLIKQLKEKGFAERDSKGRLRAIIKIKQEESPDSP